jgi:hypothetical protein
MQQKATVVAFLLYPRQKDYTRITQSTGVRSGISATAEKLGPHCENTMCKKK